MRLDGIRVRLLTGERGVCQDCKKLLTEEQWCAKPLCEDCYALRIERAEREFHAAQLAVMS